MDATRGCNGQSNMKLASENDLSGREGIQASQRITIADTGQAVESVKLSDGVRMRCV